MSPRHLAPVLLLWLQACCIPGLGGDDREVLEERAIDCGGLTAHVRRVNVTTNRFEGVSHVAREIAFGEAEPVESWTGQLGAWRAPEERPEHRSTEGLTEDGPAWLLALPADAEYRCATEHFADLEAVYGTEYGLVVFHAAQEDVVPRFRVSRGGADLGVEVASDGTLSIDVEQGANRTGSLSGRIVREEGRRVLLLDRRPLPVGTPLPPDVRDAEAVIAVARDAQGRRLLERFPCEETRLVDQTDLLR